MENCCIIYFGGAKICDVTNLGGAIALLGSLVNHQILLSKLYKYGIRGIQLAWFSDYLTNRYQYVKIGNVESDLLKITCGIPQGSTLGPLLFTLYVNACQIVQKNFPLGYLLMIQISFMH